MNSQTLLCDLGTPQDRGAKSYKLAGCVCSCLVVGAAEQSAPEACPRSQRRLVCLKTSVCGPWSLSRGLGPAICFVAIRWDTLLTNTWKGCRALPVLSSEVIQTLSNCTQSATLKNYVICRVWGMIFFKRKKDNHYKIMVYFWCFFQN